MKQVQFYLLSQADAAELSAAEMQACELAAQAWRLGKRVLIACETEQQALNIDEALWARDPDSFVPHNLSGEITTYPTPIEISWKGKRNAQRRDLLISLQTQLPNLSAVLPRLLISCRWKKPPKHRLVTAINNTANLVGNWKRYNAKKPLLARKTL